MVNKKYSDVEFPGAEVFIFGLGISLIGPTNNFVKFRGGGGVVWSFVLSAISRGKVIKSRSFILCLLNYLLSLDSEAITL